MSLSAAEPDGPYMTTTEVARLLRLSRWTIYRMVRNGELQAGRLPGGALRFSHDAVQDILRQGKDAD